MAPAATTTELTPTESKLGPTARKQIDSLFDWPSMDDMGRQDRIDACGWLDTPREPRFDNITKLMCTVFKVPISCVTLIAHDRVWAKSIVGPSGTEIPRFNAFCNYVCVPSKPEVLLTENAKIDARFTHNPFVKGKPAVLFYAGAPLVGAGGTRYGTLCVMDFVPRGFTAELYHLLINFAELAVQELENDTELLGNWTKQAIANARLENALHACISSSLDGVAFVDTRRAAWEMKYANMAFADACGQKVDELLGKGFWHVFKPIDGTKLNDITDTAAEAGSRTVLVESCETGAQLSITLHPASADRLAPGKAVGLPSWVPSENDPPGTKIGITTGGRGGPVEVAKRDKSKCVDVEKCFYFAVVQPLPLAPEVEASAGPAHTRHNERERSNTSSKTSTATGGSGSAVSSAKSKWSTSSSRSYGDFPLPPSLRGLQLGPLLGSGSFGKVYRGYWGEAIVAVKVVRCQSETTFDKAVQEGKAGMMMRHRNTVRTVKMGAEVQECYIKSVGSGPGQVDAVHILWILQEHCDRGTLADAVERGWMRTSPSIYSPPDMLTVYSTLKDIADGMAHVHDQGLIHCDLNGRNVLLSSSASDRRKFVAKVADFGLARVCNGELVEPGLFGTVTHIPPEQVRDQKLSRAGDVWAFGVTMWEVISGMRAHCGKTRNAILINTANGKGALTPPETAPQAFKDILAACMQENRRARPTFAKLGALLEHAIDECAW